MHLVASKLPEKMPCQQDLKGPYHTRQFTGKESNLQEENLFQLKCSHIILGDQKTLFGIKQHALPKCSCSMQCIRLPPSCLNKIALCDLGPISWSCLGRRYCLTTLSSGEMSWIPVTNSTSDMVVWLVILFWLL